MESIRGRIIFQRLFQMLSPVCPATLLGLNSISSTLLHEKATLNHGVESSTDFYHIPKPPWEPVSAGPTLLTV